MDALSVTKNNPSLGESPADLIFSSPTDWLLRKLEKASTHKSA